MNSCGNSKQESPISPAETQSMNDPTHGENVETAGASSSSSSPVDTRADEGLPPTYNITNADKVKLGLIYSLGMPLTSRFEAGAHADPLDDGLAYDEEIVQREKKEHPETDHHTADGPITDADYDDLHEAFGGISLNEHSDAGLPKGLDASLPIDNSVSNTASTLTSTYVSTTTAAASTISTPMKLASLSSSPAKPKRFWGGSVTDLVRSLRGPTSSITSHSISTTTNATASSSLSTSSDSNINAAGAKVDPTPAQIAYLSTCRDLSCVPSRKIYDMLATSSLQLSHFGVAETGCIAIAAALTEDPPITSIMLSDSDVTPRGAHALAESLRTQCTRTKEVDLSHNRIGLAGAFSVVRLLVSPESSISHSLTRLSLAHCFLTDAAAEALGTCLRENPTLAVLDLSTNAIGDKGAQAIAAGLEDNRSLEHLYLSWNQIRDGGGCALAAVCASSSTHLRTVTLAWNALGSTAGEAWARALSSNVYLTSLDLGHNRIGEPLPPEAPGHKSKKPPKGSPPVLGPWKAFAQAFSENVTLESLVITGNLIAPEDAQTMDLVRDASNSKVEIVCEGWAALRQRADTIDQETAESKSRFEAAKEKRKQTLIYTATSNGTATTATSGGSGSGGGKTRTSHVKTAAAGKTVSSGISNVAIKAAATATKPSTRSVAEASQSPVKKITSTSTSASASTPSTSSSIKQAADKSKAKIK